MTTNTAELQCVYLSCSRTFKSDKAQKFCSDACRNNYLASVKAAHPLRSFCESRGIALQRSGASSRFVGLCPLHDEKTPSFTVYPDGFYYCYGCSAQGDVIDLCAALDGVSLGEAAAKLASNDVSLPAGIHLAVKPKPEPYRLSDAEIARMAEAAYRLAVDNEKIKRLCKARPEWTYVGLWHTAFEGDLGIEANRIFFGYRRGIKARWKDQHGKRRFSWLCGAPHGECWRQSSLHSGHQRVFITEGETDALTGISLGLEDDGTSLVIGLAGANIIPKPEPFKGKDIVIIPDPDEAGQQSARKLREILTPVVNKIVTIDLEKLCRG